MSEFDTARNILHARIVYWGPAGCGKTTSVNTLRRLIDPEGRHRMYSVAMPDGRTHSFDLLPVEEFRFGRFRVRVRVIAAPGDAAAPDVRHALVRRADAIVFVADSRPDRVEANRASLAELEDALRSNGIDPASMPVVWTCNFQDAPAGASASDVCAALGIGAQMFESVATEGHGVLEAFADAFRYCTSAIAARHKIKDVDPNGVMPTQVLPQLVRGATRHASDKSGPLVITVPDALPAAARSAFAQLRLVEAHIETDLLRQQLVGRNAELMAINRVARSILSAMEADNLLVVLLDSTAEYLGADHASCVFFDPTNHGQLRTHVLGFGRDPILGLAAEPAQRFFEFLQNSDGPVPADPKRNPDLLHELQRVDRRVKRAMIQPIKGGRGKPAGWIAIYATADESPMSTQEVLFLSSISRLAALGVEQISMLDKVQNFSQRLEEEAHRRTGELEMANAKIRALNRGLESRVTERTRALEEANRHLRETRASAIYAARQSGMAQLGASFAHEVNNPVAGLTGNLHFMRESLDELRARVAISSSEGADGLQAIDEFESVIAESLQSAERVSGLIGSLKRFGGEEDRPDTVALNTVVADAVMLLEERMRQSAQFDLRLGTVSELAGDGPQLSHVVLALLTNAVEALERAGAPGKIDVTTFQTGDKVTLVVKDTGPGVPPEILPKVFEPFVTTKEGEPSAGLGLHCAMNTVKGMGGTIRMRSKPAEGTTVTVVLPATAVRDATDRSPTSEATGA